MNDNIFQFFLINDRWKYTLNVSSAHFILSKHVCIDKFFYFLYIEHYIVPNEKLSILIHLYTNVLSDF